jgi:hypothetical protein
MFRAAGSETKTVSGENAGLRETPEPTAGQVLRPESAPDGGQSRRWGLHTLDLSMVISEVIIVKQAVSWRCSCFYAFGAARAPECRRP